MSKVMKADSAAAFKLFGKTIDLRVVSADAMVTVQTLSSSTSSANSQDTKGTSVDEGLTEAATLSGTSSDSNRPSPASQSTCKIDQEPTSDSSASPDKTETKKPEKILPCPRCNSMDTKFCYYNNYNVNQPRHFCKNCQRYWTSGGAMRNVPVGSGRRKNKMAAIRNYRHLIIPDGIHLSASMRANGFLIFGPDFCQTTPFWGLPRTSNTCNLGKRPRSEVVFGQSQTGQGSLLDKKGSTPVSNNLVDLNGLGRSSARPIKNESFGFCYNSSMFKGIGPKQGPVGSAAAAILKANPAALSRSVNFHENV